MTDRLPEFESRDTFGSSAILTGTVGTSWTSISTASTLISEFLIENPLTNSSSKVLYLSWDGGTTFKTIANGDSWAWSPKNVTTLHLSANTASVNYQLVVNREPS